MDDQPGEGGLEGAGDPGRDRPGGGKARRHTDRGADRAVQRRLQRDHAADLPAAGPEQAHQRQRPAALRDIHEHGVADDEPTHRHGQAGDEVEAKIGRVHDVLGHAGPPRRHLGEK